MQREALEALAAVAPEARKELPALETMLAERERPVLPAAVQRQQAIAEALGQIQHADLEQRLRALGPIVELRGVEAIPHLLSWLAADRELRERIVATHVLALLDAEVALPKLRTLSRRRSRSRRPPPSTHWGCSPTPSRSPRSRQC